MILCDKLIFETFFHLGKLVIEKVRGQRRSAVQTNSSKFTACISASLLGIYSFCSFLNFSKFLENLSVGSGYGNFRLGAFIVIFTGCVHFYVFKGTLGKKFRKLSKKNFFYQTQQDEPCGLLLVLFRNFELRRLLEGKA